MTPTQKDSTALQELIAFIENDYGEFELSSNAILEKAKSLLPKERQDIINAYDAGKEQPSNSQLCPADYFIQTFKQ